MMLTVAPDKVLAIENFFVYYSNDSRGIPNELATPPGELSYNLKIKIINEVVFNYVSSRRRHND
jgi:hypothetical protein